MKNKNLKLRIIIFVVLLNSIGFAIVLPLLPFIVGKFLPATHIVVGMSALMSVFSICTFFAAPVFGSLSDRYGRKNILIISLIGSTIGYVLFGIGAALWMLFLGRIIDGLTSGNITVLFAYISDVTEPKERTKWFAYIGSAMGIGKIGGPALGGFLGSISISLPFYVTAAIFFISSIVVCIFLPESLSIKRRTQEISINSFNTFSHFKEILNNNTVKLLLIPGLLFYIGLGVFQFNFAIFMKDIYNSGPIFIGGVLTFVGIFDIVSRVIVLPRMLKSVKERNIGTIGLSVLGLGLGLMLISIYTHSLITISLAVIFIIFGEGLFDPIFNSNLSQLVDENEQGKLQGVNQSLQSLNNVIIPIAAASIYFYSPTILYSAATVVLLIASFVFSKVSSK